MRIGIIGGGASGLICAIIAKYCNKQCDVVVFEKGNIVGKKILQTGNGRCNLTNVENMANLKKFCENYNIPDVAFETLKIVTPQKTVKVLEDAGIVTRVDSKTLGVYPYSNSSATVREVLERDCLLLGVSLETLSEAVDVESNANQFVIKFLDGKTEIVDKLVVSTGSNAGTKNKHDLLGFIGKKFGFKVFNQLPALVPLRTNTEKIDGLNGLRVKASVSLLNDEKVIACESGELLFREYGVSGIVVFQLSNIIASLIQQGKPIDKLSLSINFFESFDIRNYLRERKLTKQFLDINILQLMKGILNDVLASIIIRLSGIDANKPLKKLTEIDIAKILDVSTDFRIGNLALKEIYDAQVCAGGVDVDEINFSTMGLKKVKNLYVLGEAVNIFGKCGGYNLQWAFSTGILCGLNILNEVKIDLPDNC